jgi:hypothetical protein
LFLGAASAAVYLARKYWGSDFDNAVDKVKSTAKDIGSDFSRKDEAVNSSLEKASRKVV